MDSLLQKIFKVNCRCPKKALVYIITGSYPQGGTENSTLEIKFVIQSLALTDFKLIYKIPHFFVLKLVLQFTAKRGN